MEVTKLTHAQAESACATINDFIAGEVDVKAVRTGWLQPTATIRVRHSRGKENMNQIIQLADALPCGVQSEGELCERPATVAHATRNEHAMFPANGAWTILPVCSQCAIALAAVYGVAPSVPTLVNTARAKEIAAECGWQPVNRTAIAIRNAARRGDIDAETDHYGRWVYAESSLRDYLTKHHPRKRKESNE